MSVFSSPGLFVSARLDGRIGFVSLSDVLATPDLLEQVLCGPIRHILCVFSVFRESEKYLRKSWMVLREKLSDHIK